MRVLNELRDCVDMLSARPQLDVEPEQLLAGMRSMGGEEVLAILAEVSAATHCLDRLKTVAAAVISELSSRDRGHGGLAASKGHRSPVSLVQSITGGTRADAGRAVRLGDSLADAMPVIESVAEPNGSDAPLDPLPAEQAPWHAELGRAALRGVITAEAHEAILKGLGQPPIEAADSCPSPAAIQVWAIAAEQLMAEAAVTPAEELLRRARAVRDILDPIGAEERFQRRYEARSFRIWVDEHGAHQGHFVFDDEMAAWVRSIMDAALRPRRGGPRFVDADEAKAAKALVDDPRSNEQLAYDLMMDVLRAGSLAEAGDVFGARQPGVRMMVVEDRIGPRDAFGRLLAVGHLEDGGASIPGSVVDRNLCELGSIDVVVDTCGNPLDVGREQRLFTPKQRIALAMRDGGCLWRGCGQPASYCEAHHIDHWQRDEGRTDIDRGVLLCRFHHMLLHNNAWRISRHAKGPFVLHPPPGVGEPFGLAPKAAWKWAWDPPPERSGWRAA